MPYLVFILLLSLSTSLFAQNSQPCPYYQKYIDAADAEIAKGSTANFQQVLDDYGTAMLHCPARASETREYIQKAFRAIETLKEEAQNKEREARATLRRVAQERTRSQAALAAADSIYAHNEKLVDAFYFYNDELALAYKNNRYGFINKQGEVVIDYEFDEAEQFDGGINFAKVKKGGTEYLLNSEGETFKVAYRLEDLAPDVLALDLRGEYLDGFPPAALEHRQLQVLILNEPYGNQKKIIQIPAGIGELQALRYLSLVNCELSALPPQIGNLAQLTILDLSDNQLTKLPTQFENLTQLIELNLRFNQLSVLPPYIGNLTKLTYLNLSGNQLSELPPQIGNLTQLTYLNLSNNQLSELSPQIGNLTKLTVLFLSANQLSVLPPQFRNLTQLTYLNLKRNQLSELPLQVGSLTQLTTLSLYNNQLTELPGKIGQLNRLTHLDLSHNKLTVLPQEIGQLNQLARLDLDNNPVTPAFIEELKILLPDCLISI